jgi:hypothetical protein
MHAGGGGGRGVQQNGEGGRGSHNCFATGRLGGPLTEKSSRKTQKQRRGEGVPDSRFGFTISQNLEEGFPEKRIDCLGVPYFIILELGL